MNRTGSRRRRRDGRDTPSPGRHPGCARRRVLCYGRSRDDAVARIQVLAFRVIAERLEHGEVPAEAVTVSFEAA